MSEDPKDNTLKLQIAQAIIHQSQDHSSLAQRHYNVALFITGLSVLFSFSVLGATASGKLSDKALGSFAGSIPLAACIQLINSAGKQLQASSQPLHDLLDDF